MKPLAIDLYCGLGGWTEGLLAEGYDVVGFDCECHDYGDDMRYPAQLVLQDVLTLHGSQFRDAALIVASPPCQGYSYRAMPWSRAKALPPPCNALFDACFRLQDEACAAAGRHIPMVVENVRGAEKWVGRARWNYGSYYLWGDVPALMPMRKKGDGIKVAGMSWSGSDKPGYIAKAFNEPRSPPFGWNSDEKRARSRGDTWFGNGDRAQRRRGYTAQKSIARKRETALVSKIPLELSRHVGRVFGSSVRDQRTDGGARGW